MIPLEYIVSEDLLRRIWKQIRKREREVHLTFAPLVRDSSGGIAFELTIKDALPYLRARILDGSYEPHPPLVIEAAKSKLLHQSLTHYIFARNNPAKLARTGNSRAIAGANHAREAHQSWPSTRSNQ